MNRMNSNKAAAGEDAKHSRPKLPIVQVAAAAICLVLPMAQAKAQFEWLFGRPAPAPPPAAQPGPAPAKPAKPKPRALKPKEAKKSEPAAPAPASQAEEPPPPFDPDLLRLAEILGALAYLDDLCANKSGDWRRKMQALMEAEAKTKTRKEKLAGSYNRGFRDYGRSYHICTQNAQAAIGQFLAEGEKIAHDVVARYGGS